MRVVQKYGGSSVATAEHIKRVARRLETRRAQGDEVVAVVSAMGDRTDELLSLAAEITGQPPARELDVLLSTGEMVTSTLLSMALHEIGVDAVSLTGAQAGIRTTAVFGRARISEIQTERMERELQAGRVVIVAGFQGITEDFDVTTFGRGGSDTTAVALAAALNADRCEIFTDVAGVYTADPRICPKARPLRDIGYEEMLELATTGARVMHARAVEIGELYGVAIRVASSFDDDAPGTLIHGEMTMEQGNKVRGIAHQDHIAKVTVRGVPDRPGIAANLFEPLAEAGVSVDTIVQNASVEKLTDMTFTVAPGDLQDALRVVGSVQAELGAAEVVAEPDLGTVSIVGTGMASAPGFAARMFRTLFDENINVDMISTSDIRITCVIASARVGDAVRSLHDAFELDRED
ncbi:MAG: aspartate kinase [Chloroflexi bacterium]|nr:aspartate kinase [Chloroflexota bacterium]MDA1146792.1 aspartate kinase [Chloroflexota bacterium]MQC82407.1 aspartate kinase [Chloroflexota bacterium]PKB56678.1 MAG: aspartate kinase [SAR202 cluster bacterium Casp-Chloro-G1]